MSLDFGFSEDAYLYTGLAQNLFEIVKLYLVGVALDNDGFGGRRSVESYAWNRQSQYGAGVEGKLREVLRNHGYHAGVVRPRRYFAEYHFVAFDKHLDAEDAPAAQCFGYLAGNLLGRFQSLLAHGLRLPRLAVVAVDLVVPDGFEEGRTTYVAHGEQGDFVVEVDKSFDNNAAGPGASAFLGVVPGVVDVGLGAYDALSVARRTHDGFYHAGHAYLGYGSVELFTCRGKAVRRGFQAQLLGGEAAYAFAVHGKEGGFGRGGYVISLFFEFNEGRSGDGLHLGNDVVGFFFFDDFAQFGTVEHR